MEDPEKVTTNSHHPERKEFQLDRMILFTDAVFAIAITLLVIEIHVPVISPNGSEKEFLTALLNLLPKFIGLFISFFMIALYWAVHHNIFGWVTNYTPKLIWLNMLFLFSIVLMPFTTAVYSEYSTTEEYVKLLSPYAVYVANICFTGVMNFLLLSYIFNPKNKICEKFPEKDFVVFAKRRALTIPGVFLFSLLMTAVLPGIGRMFLFLIPIVMRLLRPKKKSVRAKNT